jgi:ferredoxin-nitrate reductase
VRIEKLANPSNTLKAEIPEPQTAALAAAAHKDTATVATRPDLTARERHLELWLGETHECIVYLHEIIQELSSQLASFASDREVEAGLLVMASLTQAMADKLDPIANRLGENKTRGRHRAHILREALFPPRDEKHSPFEVLETLLGLQAYVSYVMAKVAALTPTAAAMWDDEFVAAVAFVDIQLGRVKQWIEQQVKVRGPQTLLVPSLKQA